MFMFQAEVALRYIQRIPAASCNRDQILNPIAKPILIPLTSLLLRLLEHLLHDLLLLNQERPHDTVSNTVGTSRSTIGALNSLLWA
jgi:hypothetical protein